MVGAKEVGLNREAEGGGERRGKAVDAKDIDVIVEEDASPVGDDYS